MDSDAPVPVIEPDEEMDPAEVSEKGPVANEEVADRFMFPVVVVMLMPPGLVMVDVAVMPP